MVRQIVRRAILSTIGGMTVPSRKALEGCAIEMGKAGPPDDLFFTFFLFNMFLLGGGPRVFSFGIPIEANMELLPAERGELSSTCCGKTPGHSSATLQPTSTCVFWPFALFAVGDGP